MIMVIPLHFGLHVLIASVLNAKLKGDFMVMLNLSATPVAKNHQAEIAILSLRLYQSTIRCCIQILKQADFSPTFYT